MNPTTEKDWNECASGLLKAELKRANVTYEELSRRLAPMGIEETKASIASKLARGAFPATFLIATLKAIGKSTINLEDL